MWTSLAEIPALILAGGAGTRLRSVVSDRPKPMAAVAGRPFLALQIEWLRLQGVRRIVLCTGYLHEHVERYFGDGRAFGVEIAYSVEPSPLGTAGALERAGRSIASATTFLALNGDSFLDVDLAGLVAAHAARREASPYGAGTLVLSAVADVREFGRIELDDQGRIVRFDEKTQAAPGPGWINAGIYCLETHLMDLVPPGRNVSLERETFPLALARGLALFGHPAAGFFVDIGTPQGYGRMCRHLEHKELLQP
jgi:NDP-sugar pyrophosphorylase family protein